MGKLEHFKVDLKSLKGEVTDFDYSIDDDFFAAVGGSEVSKGSLSPSGSRLVSTTSFFM